MSHTNQILNIVLAMCLAALATAASMELRSQSLDGVASQLLADNSEIKKSEERIFEESTAAEEAGSASPIASKEPRENEDAAAAMAEEATRSPADSAAPIAMTLLRSQIAPDTGAAPVEAAAAKGKDDAGAKGNDDPASARETLQAVVGGAARAPAEPKEAKLASLPAKAGIIFEDLGRKACIGGLLCEEQCKIEAGGCEAKPAYVLKLDRPAYLSAIQLFAHDGVGPSRRAELLVKVNGEPVGSAEVHRYGSTRTIKIGRVGQLVTVEARHQHNGFLKGGEEAVIWDVYLLGREPR